MERLPFLDENDIIAVKTEATGAVSPAHRRFQETEPVPDNDVPCAEIIWNPSRNVISHARSLRSRKRTLQANMSMKSNFAAANSADPQPTVNHSRTLPGASSSGPPDNVERRALNAVWSDILPPEDDRGPPPAYDTLQLSTEDEGDQPQNETAVEYEDPPPVFSEEDLRLNPLKLKSQRIVGHPVVISAGQEYRERNISRSDPEFCDAVSPPVENWGPPPPLPEDVWGSDDEEDRVPPPVYGKKAVIIDRAFEIKKRDVILHGRSAAVEDENLRMQEAMWAEERAKKAAARASKRQS